MTPDGIQNQGPNPKSDQGLYGPFPAYRNSTSSTHIAPLKY